MTLDHMRIYSRIEVDQMLSEHLAVHKEGALIGLCIAAISGAIMGALILLAVQAMFGG